VPSLLSVEALLGHFSRKRKKACLLYRKFVSEGISGPSLWEELTGQIYLGDKQFIESARGLGRNYADHEIPRQQREAARPDLSLPFAETYSKEGRNKAIYAAHVIHGYTLKEIGDHVGLHYTTVSRIIRDKGQKMLQ